MIDNNLSIDKVKSQVTDLFIQDVLLTSQQNMLNPNLTPHEEVSEIIHAMDRLGISTIKDSFPKPDNNWLNSFFFKEQIDKENKEKLEIFRQKEIVLRYLLSRNIKQKKLYINSAGHQTKTELLCIFGNLSSRDWSPAYKARYDSVLQIIKLFAADGIEVVADQFYNNPSCLLPLHVLMEAPSYLKKKHDEAFRLFDYYWNHKDDPNVSRPPLDLLEAASIAAIHLIRKESLIDHYNNKNKTNYRLNYVKATGREPRLPCNQNKIFSL